MNSPGYTRSVKYWDQNVLMAGIYFQNVLAVTLYAWERFKDSSSKLSIDSLMKPVSRTALTSPGVLKSQPDLNITALYILEITFVLY